MTNTPFEDTTMATVNGTTLAYREHGAGEPVVFVHGAMSDLRTWENQLTGIGQAYRAITYSQRYHRPNTAVEDGVDDQWVTHVADLANLLQSINAAPAHLVGNSAGALLCLLLAPRGVIA